MNSKSLGRANNPPLTIFDIGLYIFITICPVFFLLPFEYHLAQNMFFVFGVFFLFGLSFFIKRRLDYRSNCLGILVIGSLILMFIHSFDYSLSDSYVMRFLNFSLMSEGFIYVLTGCLLYFLVISYKSNFDICYPILIINIMNFIFVLCQINNIDLIWLNIFNHCRDIGGINVPSSISGMMGTRSQLAVFSAISIPILWRFYKPMSILGGLNLYFSNSFTGIVALVVASLLIIIGKRYWNIIYFLIPILFFVKWEKFFIRIETWQYAIREIIKKPFIGYGFDNTLTNNKIFLTTGGFNELTYRHNDYLNFAVNLGVPLLCVVIFSIHRTLANTKIDYLWFSILILCIACFNQTNFYFSNIAVIGIALVALKERERCESLQK